MIFMMGCGWEDGSEESGDVSNNVYMVVIMVIDCDLLDGMWVGGWVGGVWRIGKISPWPLVTVSTVSSSALFFKMFIKF